MSAYSVKHRKLGLLATSCANQQQNFKHIKNRNQQIRVISCDYDTPRLITLGLTRQPDPMFVQYMSRKVIPSFDPLIPDLLTPRNRTIHALVKVLYLVMAVQCLLSWKRGSPRATRLETGVTPPLRAYWRPTAELSVRDDKWHGRGAG